MKNQLLALTLTFFSLTAFAKADVLSDMAKKAAVAEVERQIMIPNSPLNVSHQKILASLDTKQTAKAVGLTNMESKSEYDNKILVIVPYTAVSSFHEVGSLTVVVSVMITMDENTSDVTGVQATVDPKSISLVTETPL